MLTVYILRCADDSYYVGSTVDLDRRLGQHQVGIGAKHTKPARRRPVEVVYTAEFSEYLDGFMFEKRIQNWSRAKREALIEGREDLLPRLASRSWSAVRLKEEIKEGDRLPPEAPLGAKACGESFDWDEVEPADDPDDPWAVRRKDVAVEDGDESGVS